MKIKRLTRARYNEGIIYDGTSSRKIEANLLQRVGAFTKTSGHQTQGFRSPAWCSQLPFMRESVVGLLRNKTRKPSLSGALVDRVVELTVTASPGETVQRTGRAMAAANSVSLHSVSV